MLGRLFSTVLTQSLRLQQSQPVLGHVPASSNSPQDSSASHFGALVMANIPAAAVFRSIFGRAAIDATSSDHCCPPWPLPSSFVFPLALSCPCMFVALKLMRYCLLVWYTHHIGCVEQRHPCGASPIGATAHGTKSQNSPSMLQQAEAAVACSSPQTKLCVVNLHKVLVSATPSWCTAVLSSNASKVPAWHVCYNGHSTITYTSVDL